MRKKAFISYSMKDSEQYVLTLLSNLLKSEGYFVDSSFDSLNYGNPIEFTIRKKISESNLFIGVITQTGRNDHVLKEWEQAQNYKIPSLLLIEDNVRFNAPLSEHKNILRFNRVFPEKAIRQANEKIKAAKQISAKQNGDNVLGWVLGGLAVLALINLLSDE